MHPPPRPVAASSVETPAALAQMAYAHPLRRYQALALTAFEQQRAAQHRRAYLVLPPGAGKTVLGLEAVRRRLQRLVELSAIGQAGERVVEREIADFLFL